jgi:dTDP-4-amino-4,6-dideoxygalactose transaminase
MKPVPLLDLRAQYATIKSEIDEAIARVVESQHFILGPEVEALERSLSEYCRAKYALGVSSGTDAILMALMALEIEPGDEVLTTPFTFVATGTSIARLGARAVFADIDPLTFNIDPAKIERAITPRTKAIMPVHLFGAMADLRAILDVARALPVIEDAAQAIGAERDGVRAGQTSTFGCFSFFPSKNLGAFGDGGLLVTNDDALAHTARLVRNHGQQPKYFCEALGGNFRLDALQAAILRAKLPHLDRWTEGRQKNARRYAALFAESKCDAVEGDLAPGANVAYPAPPAGRHIYNQYVIRARRRDDLRAFLTERKIGCEVYYPRPMHLQSCFASWGHARGDFPESERAADECLGLPIYPELDESALATVVAAIADFYRGSRA